MYHQKRKSPQPDHAFLNIFSIVCSLSKWVIWMTPWETSFFRRDTNITSSSHARPCSGMDTSKPPWSKTNTARAECTMPKTSINASEHEWLWRSDDTSRLLKSKMERKNSWNCLVCIVRLGETSYFLWNWISVFVSIWKLSMLILILETNHHDKIPNVMGVSFRSCNSLQPWSPVYTTKSVPEMHNHRPKQSKSDKRTCNFGSQIIFPFFVSGIYFFKHLDCWMKQKVSLFAILFFSKGKKWRAKGNLKPSGLFSKTTLKFNSSPLKRDHPKRKTHFPTITFPGRAVNFRGKGTSSEPNIPGPWKFLPFVVFSGGVVLFGETHRGSPKFQILVGETKFGMKSNWKYHFNNLDLLVWWLEENAQRNKIPQMMV